MTLEQDTSPRPEGKTTIPLLCFAMNSRPRAFDENGQAMVEMALALPVLLLVLTGILTFGLAFNNYVLLTEATSIGARTLAISRGATTDPCATALSRGHRSRAAALFGEPVFYFFAQRHHLYRHIV